MLQHLQDHLTHASAPTWIEEFTSLVEGQDSAPVAAPSQALPLAWSGSSSLHSPS